jgi:nitroreductase
MRRLKDEPIPDDLICEILQAGMSAANAGNRQRWRFLVIKDRRVKQRVQKLYKRAFDEIADPAHKRSGPPPGTTSDGYERQHAAVEYLTNHIHEAPVWIVPCADTGNGSGGGPDRASGAMMYPAVQNMLLAARALGLGATLTTRHLQYEEESEAALGLPPGVHSYAIIPIGYPMGRFGPVRRGHLSEFVYQDRWGEAYPPATTWHPSVPD